MNIKQILVLCVCVATIRDSIHNTRKRICTQARTHAYTYTQMHITVFLQTKVLFNQLIIYKGIDNHKTQASTHTDQ